MNTVSTSSPDGRPERAEALATSIMEFEAGGYHVDRVVDAVCECGNRRFNVLYDDEVGVAVRVCTACGTETAMLDSDDHFDDVESVVTATCSCGGQEFVVSVGFALRTDGEVRWVSVGLSCLRDSVAGVYTDWKIDYSPSAHLLSTV